MGEGLVNTRRVHAFLRAAPGSLPPDPATAPPLAEFQALVPPRVSCLSHGRTADVEGSSIRPASDALHLETPTRVLNHAVLAAPSGRSTLSPGPGARCVHLRSRALATVPAPRRPLVLLSRRLRRPSARDRPCYSPAPFPARRGRATREGKLHSRPACAVRLCSPSLRRGLSV